MSIRFQVQRVMAAAVAAVKKIQRPESVIINAMDISYVHLAPVFEIFAKSLNNMLIFT